MQKTELTSARDTLWRQDGNAALTRDDAREWLDTVGFAAPGSSTALPDFSRATGEGAAALLAALTRSRDAVLLLSAPQASGATDQGDVLVSRRLLPFFYALRGDRTPRKPPQGTPLAREIWEALSRSSGSALSLASTMGRGLTEGAILRQLRELWLLLRVVPQPPENPDEPIIWHRTDIAFAGELRTGAQMAQGEALSVLLAEYLHAAIAASDDDIQQALGAWSSRQRLQEVLQALRAARAIQLVPVERVTCYAPAGGAAEEMLRAADDREREALRIAREEHTASLAAAAAAPEDATPQERPSRPPKAFDRERRPQTGFSRPRREGPAGERKPFRRDTGTGERKPFRRDDARPRKPFQRRPEGDAASPASPRPFRPRPDGAGAPPFRERKTFRPRREGEAGSFPPRKPFRREGEGGERKPFRPRPQEGDARREFRPRPDGAGAPPFRERKTFRPRREGEAGSFPPRKPFRREGEGGERKPFRPRPQEGDARREFRPRTGTRPPFRREGGDAGRAPFRPRREQDGPPRPFRPRAEGDRPARAPREGGEKREWKPKKPFAPREGGEKREWKPKKPFAPLEGGEKREWKPKKPFTPREGGEKREWKPKKPFTPREGGARPPRRDGFAKRRPGAPPTRGPRRTPRKPEDEA